VCAADPKLNRQYACIAALTLAAALLTAPSASRADILYVASLYNQSILKFDTATGANLGVFANTGLSEPEGIAFDSSGNLYAANFYTSSIEKFTPKGIGSIFAYTGSYQPIGLAFDNQGNLYVADGGNNTSNNIVKFTPSGASSVFAADPDGPEGLAFDSAGNLFVANWRSDTIEKFTPDGVGSIFVSNDLAYPEGLAFDGAGNLFVTSAGNNKILKFTPSGAGSEFATNGLNAPQGIAFDSAGNLFVVNAFNNSIEEFKSSGGILSNVGSIFVASRILNYPSYIAIQVPEPSTWAMLGVGLSVLLVFCRRKT